MKRPRRTAWARFLIPGVFGAWVAGAALAAPFRPPTLGHVLARVPADPARELSDLRRRRAAAAGAPNDADLALALARRALELAGRRQDPRLYGTASAALRPLLGRANPDPRARWIRARIRQARHDFVGALTDLDAILQVRQDHSQAALDKAAILVVLGRYKEAQSLAARLILGGGGLAARALVAWVASYQGRLEVGATMLERELDPGLQVAASELAFAYGMAGELAARSGRAGDARAFFAQGLKAGPDDPLLLAALADLELQQGQPQAVLSLISSQETRDVLRLRRALALRAAGNRETAGNLAADLLARHDAARARGDRSHLREEAQLRLELLDQPEEALRAAQENFRQQKEVDDAAILVAAARQAKQPKAAQEVLAWWRKNRVQDTRLAPGIADLETQLKN